MIIDAIVFGLITVVVGLLSLSLVTGASLGSSFTNSKMAGVFFVTGVLMVVLTYIVQFVSIYKCKKDEKSQ